MSSIVISVAHVEYLDVLRRWNGEAVNWTVVSTARPGDTVLFYITSPECKIVAKGTVASQPARRPFDGKMRFMADIGPVEMLATPLTLECLRRQIPAWDWPQRPQQPRLSVPENFAKHLARLVGSKTSTVEAGRQERGRSVGGGFGSAEENRLVELAAVKAVTEHFTSKGYTVRSVENEQIGYDLVVENGRRELHVEVKGVSGGVPEFVITKNEVSRSQDDLNFRLAVVTNAREKSMRKIKLFSREEFRRKYQLKPTAYFAKMK